MFLNAKYSPIGIDLGGSLKLVQFRMKGNPPRPEFHAATSLALQIPNNGHSEGERAAFVKELKKALANGKFGTRRAVVALPSSDVLMRPLTLPVNEHDIAKKVRWEAESYLEGSVDDSVIDHVVLGEAKTAGERRLEVLAISADKHKTLNALELLGHAGLTTEIIDIVPLALCRALQAAQAAQDSAAAAVDIGARSTTAVIMVNNELRMARPIGVGGDDLTDAIQTALEISREEAEIMKCQHGAAPPRPQNDDPDAAAPAPLDEANRIGQIVHDILRDKLDNLANELQKLFRYFSAQNQGRSVERALLFGGGGALKHLDALLAARLNAQVDVGEPLAQITGGKVELKRGNEGSFAVAAGLALRGL